jgi:hypothetical protein
LNRSNGSEWLRQLDADAEKQFRTIVRAFAAVGEPFPAAAAVWRDLDPGQLAALAALSSSPLSRPVPFAPDWMQLSAPTRQRALLAMRRVVELAAVCVEALELEAQLRRNPNQRELFT